METKVGNKLIKWLYNSVLQYRIPLKILLQFVKQHNSRRVKICPVLVELATIALLLDG